MLPPAEVFPRPSIYCLVLAASQSRFLSILFFCTGLASRFSFFFFHSVDFISPSNNTLLSCFLFGFLYFLHGRLGPIQISREITISPTLNSTRYCDNTKRTNPLLLNDSDRAASRCGNQGSGALQLKNDPGFHRFHLYLFSLKYPLVVVCATTLKRQGRLGLGLNFEIKGVSEILLCEGIRGSGADNS